ncbi:MAG: hypothetical protein IT249_05035 [Chitinophagaceae bacterium]|nr:hypothetical protein [Chitinophagaceae bacterium]
MSQVIINRSERSAAFWKFILFFVTAVAFIVSAVYFNFNLPTRENSLLKQQVSRYKVQEEAQETFVKTMEDAKLLIDSIGRPGAQAAFLNQQAAAKIQQLVNLQYKDSSIYNQLNKSVLDLFLRYQELTNKMVTLGDAPQQLQEYKQKYEQAQRDLEDARRNLDIIRSSSN